MTQSTDPSLPQMPGGYESGAAAVRDLVHLSQLLSAAQDARTRLNHASGEIDRMISRTDAARRDALRAIERFADEQPTSLGVVPSPQLAGSIADTEGRLTAMEADVAEVLRRAGPLQ